MKDKNKIHVTRMLKKIDDYSDSKLSFNSLIENLWALYEAIDEEKSEIFIDGFHKHWDFLEEIRAISSEEKYKETIHNKILKELKDMLNSYL